MIVAKIIIIFNISAYPRHKFGLNNLLFYARFLKKNLPVKKIISE